MHLIRVKQFGDRSSLIFGEPAPRKRSENPRSSARPPLDLVG